MVFIYVLAFSRSAKYLSHFHRSAGTKRSKNTVLDHGLGVDSMRIPASVYSNERNKREIEYYLL